jgi:putative component of membrane protein insertase Oxa1/YidC/SpoIIIJ protein YidD
MANWKNSGTMTLNSRTAVALWTNEICGQISDGMWENSTPHDHWQFWCRLNVVLGPESKVDVADEAKYSCRKNAYALTRLHQEKFNDGKYVLRDRMLACGRMARAGADPTDRETLSASEYMPATLEEFRAAKAAGSWKHDFVAKYMDKVNDELAEKFYAASYTLKEMNADLNLIKHVMKTVQKYW